MIIINTQEDIKKMEDQDSIDSSIISYLGKYFVMLSKEYSDGNRNFSLENYGSIAYLENTEDTANLSAIGLHTDYRQTTPEYVDCILLQGDNGLIELYSACIVLNNEVAITVFSTRGTLDAETESFLSNESG